MTSKLLQSLTDDNLDLQKQIGCMTGIFQLLDRQHNLTGRRRIVGQTPKRLPAGKTLYINGTSEGDSNSLRYVSLDKYSNKSIQERRVFTESSVASFSSSSRSSSFSSIDCNRTNQLEPTSHDLIISPEIPSREPSMSMHNSSPQFSRQAIDLRDLVKDSMYREVQGLSIKDKATEEVTDPAVRLRASRRIESKTVRGPHVLGPDKKSVTPADLKDSLRVPSKLHETTHNAPRELLRSLSYHSKDVSSFPIYKDAPRFSYDGREINHTPDVPKSYIKLRDLPRLSLDSREGSMRTVKADSKATFSVKTMQEGGEFDKRSQNMQQLPGNLARPPSVVAKLMGLETLPDAVSSNDTNVGSSRSYQMEEFVTIPRSSAKTDAIKPTHSWSSNSSKNLLKDSSSPSWRNPDPSLKPMSRFPIEPAPWKQNDGTKILQKPTSKSTKGPAKSPSTFPTVYGEIEKRLKDLEFTQSGKDLRALKQILEAMQVKGLLETEKEGQDSNYDSHKHHDPILPGSRHDGRSLNDRKLNDPASSKKRVISLGNNFESPIVIMKPAKLVEKSGISADSVISLTDLPKNDGSDSVEIRNGLCTGNTTKKPATTEYSQCENPVNSGSLKNDRALKVTQTSAILQPLAKENNSGSGKSSGATSPRVQQKKVDQDKRSRPPTPPSGSGKLRRQANKQQTESVSSGGKRRPRHPNLQQSSECLTEIRVETMNHKMENGVQSIQHYKGAEVHIFERSPSVSRRQIPSVKASGLLESAFEEKKTALTLNEEESSELASAPCEYLSPVSVLDTIVHKDDSSSPVKYIGKSLKVDGTERNTASVQEIHRKKLQNIENLVQKLTRLNSSHDEAHTDYIASLCENSNPDTRYVSEILLASGLLLRDLGSSLINFQFHSSGHPINPELFFVLEQTKASTLLKDGSITERTRPKKMTTVKFHRKLIFDVVNEILVRRLSSPGPPAEPWSIPIKHSRNTVNPQRLLKDLCSEIEGLQAKSTKQISSDEEDDRWKNILYEDIMHRLESWSNFDDEIQGPVLDIERLIFKDLVNEIVIGESTGLMSRPSKRSSHIAK